MKLTLFGLLGAGAADAAAQCPEFYPAHTVVHASQFDFESAQSSNTVRVEPLEGVLGVAVPSGKRARPQKAVVESDVVTALYPFNMLVLSAGALLPSDTSMEIEASLGFPEPKTPDTLKWSGWYRMGVFKSRGESESVREQDDQYAKVDVDTLRLKRQAAAFKYRITLQPSFDSSPVLRLVAATYVDTTAKFDEKAALRSFGPVAAKRKPAAWGLYVSVPQRSQMVEQEKYAKDICSPTALSMLMEYYGVAEKTVAVAMNVCDQTETIYGNWAFNTAYAASKGFDAFVRRINSVAEAEREIILGRPLIASITYAPGELKNAPMAKSRGHLVVIKGFDKDGNFLVNDPAGSDEKGVHRVYDRKEFTRAWLKNKQGLSYYVAPRLPRYMEVAVALSDLRREPVEVSDAPVLRDPMAESQLLMGELVRVTAYQGDWVRVDALEQSLVEKIGAEPRAYSGWMKADELSWAAMPAWRYSVRAKETQVDTEMAEGGVEPVTVYMGTRFCPVVRGFGQKPALDAKGRVRVLLSGGAAARVPAEMLYDSTAPLKGKALREAFITAAARFAGDKYLWGGRSDDGIDCSGLVSIAARACGLDLPRNARDQYNASRKLTAASLVRGDLVFLQDAKDGIYHVMIYLGGERLFEATADVMKVRETTFREKLGVSLKELKTTEKGNGQKILFGTYF